MTSTSDVLVIGGGIAGLTTALSAAERGLAVTIVDTPREGSASRAAAGMLAPSVEGLPADVKSIAIAARDMYPAFLAQLFELSGVEVPLDRNGILQLADSPESLASFVAGMDPRSSLLSSEDLARLEPSFSGRPGGILHALDGAVDNVALMGALDVAVASAAKIRRLHEIAELIELPAGLAVVRTSGRRRLESPRLVVASGAWCATLPGLPRPLEVRPLRGQLLQLETHPIEHVTYGAGGYLVPRGASLIIGATSEEVEFANGVTNAGLMALRAIAKRAIPALEGATVLGHWSGFRPVTPDALPILGADPDHSQLTYAVGFSRNGILLAPWAARQIAAEIAGDYPEAVLHIFSVQRFDKTIKTA